MNKSTHEKDQPRSFNYHVGTKKTKCENRDHLPRKFPVMF